MMCAQPHEHVRLRFSLRTLKPELTVALIASQSIAFKESEIVKSRNLRYSINSDP